MIKNLFSEQRKHLNYFFDAIDHRQVEKILDKLLTCRGTIIFSGIGKSGIIAKKLAVTFTSMGTKACFLSPLDALHGDLGIVSADDIFLLLSKSGQTIELLNVLPHIKARKAFVIGVLSSVHSSLDKECDLSIILPIVKELCPYNLAPTTSSAIQLIFGDILSVALMQRKGISFEQYSLNHPSGSIGKKTTLIVDKLMRKGGDIPFCSKDDLVAKIIPTLSSKRCGAILVVDNEKKLLGIFTDGDLRRAIESYPKDVFYQKVFPYMSKSFKWITKDTLAFDALKLMEKDSKKLIMVLPVLENNKVVGILHMHDILQAGLSL